MKNFVRLIDFSPLQSLSLKELQLWICPSAEQTLFVPGALTALRRLDIRNIMDGQAFYPMLGSQYIEDQQEVQQICQAAAALMTLPSLIQISGCGKIFMVDVISKHPNWFRDVHIHSGCHNACECSCLKCLNGFQNWRRIAR